MYESFFGLRVRPFNLTPNPDFLYLSQTHREVYAHLLYGMQNRVGFIEVTGEVGTGKTTILRTFLNDLDAEVFLPALIFNPKLTAVELLRAVNREFGVPDQGESSARLIEELNRFLLAENHAGRVPVLVIDEAQNLSGDVLEQIRLLSNLETETEKLIQIVLAGQPELGRLLSRPELRQLDQRIAVRYHLKPLNEAETRDYIRHRLKIAGRPDGELFAPGALKKIHQLSGGVPRLINVLCDRTLLVGYADSVGRMTRREVMQASREMSRERGGREPRRRWVYGLAGAVLLIALGWLYQADLLKIERPILENVRQELSALAERLGKPPLKDDPQ